MVRKPATHAGGGRQQIGSPIADEVVVRVDECLQECEVTGRRHAPSGLLWSRGLPWRNVSLLQDIPTGEPKSLVRIASGALRRHSRAGVGPSGLRTVAHSDARPL